MTPSTLYNVGDSVRVVAGDNAGTYATIEHVSESASAYRVRFTRDTLLDSTALVAHEHCERYRKQRYELGDVVELHLEPIHEGPHPDDILDPRPRRVAVVERVETHPNNDEWVVGYGVVERDDDHVERHFVKSGSVARLASSLSHDQLSDAFIAAGADPVELAHVESEELFDNDGMPMLSSLPLDAYERLLPLLAIVEQP